MALYLGSTRVQITLDNVVYNVNSYSEKYITNSILLLSADDYILQDLDGIYIVAEEGEQNG